MPFFKWSKTPASNGGADPTINWAEGQPPASVNDSGRAMMAAAAKWRDDISGTITTGGTSTAYTLTSNSVFDSLANMNGAMIAFVPHTTNGATVTLNVDGLGNKPLRLAPSVELPSGVIVQGTPYVATYNNSDGAWYLQGYTINPYIIPIGAMMPYTNQSATPNSSFVFPYGQAISRTTYSVLFALIGTAYGSGDGSTTFNVPDIRGRAIFGLQNMGGVNAALITVAGGNFDGAVLGNTGGGQNQTLTQGQLPAVAPTFIGTQQTWSTNQTNIDYGITTGNLAAGGFPTNAVVASGGAATTTITPAGTISNLGSGQSHPVMPPAIVLPYILRII
jgi:microcystin-dependent protein